MGMIYNRNSESYVKISDCETIVNVSTNELIADTILDYYGLQEYPNEKPVRIFLSCKGPISPDMVQAEWKNHKGWQDQPFNLNDPDVRQQIVSWINDHPIDLYDHYRSVNAFKTESRKEGDNCDNVLDGRILHTESDEVSSEIFRSYNLMPTLEIESSPGHYYHFWELDQVISAKKVKELNKRLIYVSGKSKPDGFDLAKVLRISLTKNLKPVYREGGKSAPVVSELQRIGQSWTLEDLERALCLAEELKAFRGGNADTLEQAIIEVQEQPIPVITQGEFEARVKQYKAKGLHETHIRYLYADTEDRSASEFAVVCELLKWDIMPLEISKVIKASPLNKYEGRKDQDHRIWETIRKASIAHKVQMANTKPLPQDRVFTLSYSSGDELLRHPAPPVEWVVSGFLEVGTCMLFVADGGTGKSFTIMDMLIDICLGNIWLAPPDSKVVPIGQFIVQFDSRKTKRCIVVYFNQDTGRNEFHRRLERLAKARNGSLKDFIIIDTSIDLTNGSHKKEIRRFLKSLSADGSHVVAVFDTLTSCSGGIDENKVQDVKPVMEFLAEELAHIDGHTIIPLHHTQKNGNRFRGSSHLKNAVDSVINLERTGKVSSIIIDKNRCETITTFKFTLVREGDRAYFVEVTQTPKEAKADIIEETVKSLLVNSELNQKQVLDKVREKIPGAGKDAIKDVLKRLKDDKAIKSWTGKRNAIMYATP